MFKYMCDTCVLRYLCYTYIIHMKYICIVQHMFNMCGEIGCVQQKFTTHATGVHPVTVAPLVINLY